MIALHTLLAAEGKEPVTGPMLYILVGVAVIFALIIGYRVLKRR